MELRVEKNIVTAKINILGLKKDIYLTPNNLTVANKKKESD